MGISEYIAPDTIGFIVGAKILTRGTFVLRPGGCEWLWENHWMHWVVQFVGDTITTFYDINYVTHHPLE